MCKERVEHSLSATDEPTRDQPLPKCKCSQTTDKWLSHTTPPTTCSHTTIQSYTVTDPTHLKHELLKINKQIPTRFSLPEDPHKNIWHYYKFLTVTPVIHNNRHILMIKIPLTDLDSDMNLYKIYNLPVYHHDIGTSLKYQLEGTNLAVTKDNKYATLLTDTEFITCTLAEGYFCNLNTGLYHIDTNQWCDNKYATLLTDTEFITCTLAEGHFCNLMTESTNAVK